MSNKQRKVTNQSFVKQDLALDSYLSTLLTEIPSLLQNDIEQKIAKIEPKPKKRVKVKSTYIPRRIKPQAIEHTRIEKEVKLKEIDKKESLIKEPQPIEQKKPFILPKIAKENSVDTQVKIIKTQEIKADVVDELDFLPDYMREDFLALFFRVGESVLAIPLVSLARTIRFDLEGITKMPSQPSWYLGVKYEMQKKVGILNMNYLINDEGYNDSRDYDVQPLVNILLTLDGEWGLACDEVMNISKIAIDKVHWRLNRKYRPWFLGTLTDELAIIADLDQCILNKKNITMIRR